MGLLSAVWHPTIRADVTWQPLDERWYTSDLGLQTDAGVLLSAESILRCDTVLAAVRFRGDSWAMCPPATFRKTARGREEMPEHYSQRVLRNPNAWMTGNRWRSLMGVWMATWGNAYNEIVAGRLSMVDELRPLHPSRTRVKDQRADGSLLYEYAPPNGAQPRLLGQERVLHFRDISTDGIRGLEMYQLIRNAVAVALAAERHKAVFLKKGARVAGLVEAPAGADDKKRDELKDALRGALGGAENSGTIAVVPNGIKVSPISSTNRDSQLVELSEAQVGSILRFLGVPGVVVGWQGDKASTYASADAFFEKGGIKHCVLPILTNAEAEEEKALLLPGDGLQIKHNLDALQRANWKDRIAGLVQATGGPIFSVNEAREIEDFNAIEDERFDRPHIPSNMVGWTEQPEPPNAEEEPPQEPRRPMLPNREDDEERASALGRQLALDAAARVVRRELSALRDRAAMLARNPSGFREWAITYYRRHAVHVATVMHVTEDQAQRYADGQRDAIIAGGLVVAEQWEETVPQRLADLALAAHERG